MISDDEFKRRLYVPNFEQWKQHYNKDWHSDEEPGVRTLVGGIVLPTQLKNPAVNFQYKGGVCDRDFNFVAGYNGSASDNVDNWCCVNASYTVERKKLEHIDEDVIFGGATIFHFGHFITESICRLWYVAEHPEDKRKVVFIQVCTWKPGNWMYQLLELLGISRERVMIVDKPTQFRSIVIPDQGWRIKHSYTEKIFLPYRRMVEAITPRNDVKKIFLTRSHNVRMQRYIANAEYFEEFYRRRGYRVVLPEKLSFTEQLALITGADEIVTHMGTLSHWSIFCRPGVDWTYLTRVEGIGPGRQAMIDKAMQINWHVVDTTMNFMNARQGDGIFFIGATEYWRRFVLEKYGVELGDDSGIPFSVFDTYVERWCDYTKNDAQMNNRRNTLKKIYGRLQRLESLLESRRPMLCCETYQLPRGWSPRSIEGEVSGDLENQSGIEALKIYFAEEFLTIEYAVHYRDGGWSETFSNGETAGDLEHGTPIDGVRMIVDNIGNGEGVDRQYNILYRVHSLDGTWSRWESNDTQLISSSAIDGIQIKLANIDDAECYQ